MASMQEWTDGAIVVTQPGGEWIYLELARHLPYLNILPGARAVGAGVSRAEGLGSGTGSAAPP